MTALPPSRRGMQTDDPTRAQESVSSLFDASLTLTVDPPAGFRYQMAAVSDDALLAAAFRFGGSISSEARAFPRLVVAHAVAGQHKWRIGAETGDGRLPFLIPPDTEFRARFDRLHLRAVTIEQEALSRTVRALTGAEPRRIRFDRPNESARDHALIAETLRFVEATLIADERASASPLLRAQFVHQVVASLVTAYPLLPDGLRDATGAAPRAVRRAVAYMEEHVAQPITVADAALAAGTSVRGLQVAFRRAFGTSPSAFLRRIRLEGAHADLRAADAGETTVRDIALRWGFGHAGRFAHLYSAEYGEPPSHTLRR